MIDGNTRLLGVIGDPIRHSLSPIMHNFILDYFGLNYCYHSFHIVPEKLKEAIRSFKLLDFVGINVTLPHKQTIIALLDDVAPDARKLKAVNTVLFQNGKAIGYNTDCSGFLSSLSLIKGSLRNQKAVVLGAGGSARAVIYALIQMGVNEIMIYNRSLENAERLVRYIREAMDFSEIYARQLSDYRIFESIQKAKILINATSVGMAPYTETCPLPESIIFPEGILVYDLIYNPVETKLLKMANFQGVRTMSGLDMLVLQGVESLKIWTGKNIDVSKILSNIKKLLLQQIDLRI